jgi:hypothetical protein
VRISANVGDWDADSSAGMGRTNDRIARIQESYVANATTGWLESLERSLAMMKEYQVGDFALGFCNH